MAVYRIDPVTGYLKNIGFYPCLGKTPRFFCFAPNGKCYVANEDSDTIIEFDFERGQLVPTMNMVATGSPVCITFAKEER
jgi:6-phosphogluconolactonase (cycloisomerase 2 family)